MEGSSASRQSSLFPRSCQHICTKVLMWTALDLHLKLQKWLCQEKGRISHKINWISFHCCNNRSILYFVEISPCLTDFFFPGWRLLLKLVSDQFKICSKKLNYIGRTGFGKQPEIINVFQIKCFEYIQIFTSKLYLLTNRSIWAMYIVLLKLLFYNSENISD